MLTRKFNNGSITDIIMDIRGIHYYICYTDYTSGYNRLLSI